MIRVGAVSGATPEALRERLSVALVIAMVGLFVVVPATVRADSPQQGAAGLDSQRFGAIAPDPTPQTGSAALRQLRRAAEASSNVTYTGVQFVSAWTPSGTASTLLDVANMPGTGTALRVRGSGSGTAAATFVSDHGALDGGIGGGVLEATVELLARNYAIRLTGTAQTAGRTAYVVEMRGAAGVQAARFWIDKKTGVLLRREVFDSSGRTIRASAFVDIHMGAKRLPDHVPPVVVSSTTQSLDTAQVATLRTSGWDCPPEVAGTLTLFDARTFQADGPAVHLSYSDGLSTVSVFQQRGTLDAAGLDGYTTQSAGSGVVFVRAGVPEQILWSAGGIVYTVLADAPQEAVARVVDALPHEASPGDGVLDRIGRGLTRVGSWLNPFA